MVDIVYDSNFPVSVRFSSLYSLYFYLNAIPAAGIQWFCKLVCNVSKKLNVQWNYLQKKLKL